MQKVLCLDDSEARHNMLLRNIPSAVCVFTAAECIEKLENEAWDTVFLDHDLGGETYADSSNANTGMEVVQWVVENKPDVHKFIVHSMNIPAAVEMAAKLKDLDLYVVHQVPCINLYAFTGK